MGKILFVANKNNFIKNNKDVLLVFFITIAIFSIVFSYQIINYEQNLKGKPNASFLWLITGDEPHYVSLTSNIIYHQNVFLENHFTSQFSGINKDPFMTWPENFKKPLTWHAEQREDGHWVTVHGPGLSYLILPGYILGGIYGVMVTMALAVSITSIVIYKFCSALTNNKIAFFTTIIFSFCTLLFTYSNKIFPDVIISVLVISSLYCVFQKFNSRFFMAMGGALLGLGIFFKISFFLFDIVLIPLIFILAFKHRISWQNLSVFVVFFIFLSIMAILNNILVYDNWIGGERTVSALEVITKGHEEASGTFADNYSQYWPNVLIENFFGRFHGLFIFSPIVMLSALGIEKFWKKNKTLTITCFLISIVLIIGHLLILTIASIIGGDPPFRYFLPLVPLAAIPFATGIQRFSHNWIYRALFILLLIPSFAFSIAFAYHRSLPLAHLDIKRDLVSMVYPGIDFLFTNSGLASVGSIVFPHVPITNENMFFLIIMTTLLTIGIILPFLKFKIKSINNVKK